MNKAKVSISVRLNPTQHEELNAYAETNNKSMANLIDEALTLYLDSKKLITTVDTDSEDLYIRVVATAHQDGYDEIALLCYHHPRPLIQVCDVPKHSYDVTIEYLQNSVDFVLENIM